MKSWHASHYSRWFAVARADCVNTKPVSVVLLDQWVVIARLANGKLMALEDRCPHRQVPLSSGCVTANGISCPYHGWSFTADGALEKIPGMPLECLLPAVRVRSFAVQQHDGLIWLRLGEGSDLSLSNLVQELKPSARRFLWQTSWNASVVDAMENFLDPMHTHCIHPGIVRRNQTRFRSVVNFDATTEGFCVDYSSQTEQSGLLFRLFESKRTIERAHFAAPGSAQIEYQYKKGGIVRITLHFSPRTHDFTNVFATLHVEKRWAPAWAVRLFVWPFLRRVGEQDRRVLQLQSENLNRFPAQRGASSSLDIVRSSLEQFWQDGKLPDIEEHREIEMML